MSTAHLAFSAPNSVGGMSEPDLETVSEAKPLTHVLMIRYGLYAQAVDKLGRIARRTPGMHVRNAISKPRLATTIRRMTATLNFLAEPRECEPLS
jgi:ABC-type enterochelin transport system substrate-binding protein